VLTHEYTEVDLGIVAASIPQAVHGYRRYLSAVAAFLLTRAATADEDADV
jgi:uncharacterized protein YutE (UPF0331/DUF86 family)